MGWPAGCLGGDGERAGGFTLWGHVNEQSLGSASHGPPLPVHPPSPPQVLGHSKTILVLLGGWSFLGDTITGKKLAGMLLAVAGMVW